MNKLVRTLVTALVLVGVVWILKEVSRTFRADVFFAKGIQQQQLGNYPQSYQWLQKAVDLNPHRSEYFKELARTTVLLAQATGNRALLEGMETYAQKSYELSPTNLLTLKSLALTYREAGRMNPNYLQKADAILEFAANLCPTDPQIRYTRAVTKLDLNQTGEALDLINQALDLKPDYQEAEDLKSKLMN